MRTFLPIAVAALIAGAIVGIARASQAIRPADRPKAIKALRESIDYYRGLTWLYQATAGRHRTPTSYSYRHSPDGAYLRWSLAIWQANADRASRRAISSLREQLDVTLPAAPGLHAALAARVAYNHRLAMRLESLVHPSSARARTLQSARLRVNEYELQQWQSRAAHALLDASRHLTRMTLAGPRWLTNDFLCIHHFEGSWTSNTGNGYYGGLQMNSTFMARYGPDFLRRYGTADRWPAWAQIEASVRAYQAGRGFWPWPNTAAACGLL